MGSAVWFLRICLNLLLILSRELMQIQLRKAHYEGINMLCSLAETKSGVSNALSFK